MSIKVLHTADLHLGSGKTCVKDGKAEIENTFFKIIDLCKTAKIDFLLIAGDLFDTPFVSHIDAERVISAISKIPETIVAISPGNHDCACPGSVYLKYKFPDNTVVFRSSLEYRDFPEKSVRLWGAGFTHRFEESPLLQSPKNIDTNFINLCVVHGDMVANNSQSTYNPIYPSFIEEAGFDYIALGHIHKRSSIQKIGKTYFGYSGCPDGMGFDELGSHGVYMGKVAPGLCELEYIETSSRQYIEETINVSESQNSFTVSDLILKNMRDKFGENFEKNLYRITLIGDIPADSSIEASKVQTILAQKLLHIEIFDKTSTSFADLSTLSREVSLRGVFVKKMLERLSSSSEDEKVLYENALKLGLKAFSKGVTLSEN